MRWPRPPILQLRPRRLTVLIVVLLVLFTLAKGAAWAILIPLGQHPDENVHQTKVDYVARTGELGTQQRASVALETTLAASAFHRMPQQPWAKAPFDDAAAARYDEAMKQSRADRDEPSDRTQSLGYPPTYYVLGAAIMRAFDDARYDTAWLAARMLGSVMVAAAIALQFCVLRRVLSGDAAKAGIAAFALTSMPLYSAMGSAINPEVLIVLLVSAGLLLALRIHDAPRSIPLHVGFAAVLLIAYLTKQNGLIVIAPYVVALVAHLRHRVTVGIGLVVASLGALGMQVHGAGVSGAQLAARVHRVIADFKHRNSDLYWSYFGWHDAVVSRWMLDILFCAGVGAAAILLFLILRRETTVPVAMCIATVGLAFVGIVQIELVSDTGFGQGRYYFGAVAAIVGLQFWVLDRLVEPSRMLTAIAWPLAALIVLAFHVNSVMGAVIPRYYL